MRNKVLVPFVTETVKRLFDEDVAEAFISDAGMFEAVCYLLNKIYGIEERIAEMLERVAERLPDYEADWLAEKADSPSGWLYRRIQEG